MVIGLAGVTGACVQAIVVLLVIKSEAECVLIHYLLIEVHTVPVSHTINDLAYQEGPALEYQLTESGHRGLNGHSAPILVTMVISLEQGSLLLKFCSNPRPSEGGMQCVGSDFEIMSCNDTSRCLHCRGLQRKMERGLNGIHGQLARPHVALLINYVNGIVECHTLRALVSRA
uniref:Secreted protein n=1 Tax=Loa loa TaxID=7209 RepID=A0A1I7VP10_LOALO